MKLQKIKKEFITIFYCIRTRKNINGIETKYYLEGTKIIYEERDGQIIYYKYDDSGVIGLEINNKKYYFVKNIQGDIIEIVDEENEVEERYEYDTWGRIISIKDKNGNDVSSNSTHIMNINPYRYRGYYYDSETKLYYKDNMNSIFL